MLKRPCELKSATNKFEIHGNVGGCLEPARILSQGPEALHRSLPDLYNLDSYGDQSLTQHPPFQIEQRERGNFRSSPSERRDYECRKTNISSAVTHRPDDDYRWASSCAPKQENRSKMELPGLKLCYEPQQENFTRQTCRECKLDSAERYSGSLSPGGDSERMRPNYIDQAISKEFIDNYCRTLQDLEQQRRYNKDLREDYEKLQNELKKSHDEIQSHRKSVQAETQLRGRIQKDLRKLADLLESDSPLSADLPNITTDIKDSRDTDDIEYYKDQFRVYQEDFRQEREEKLKLRQINAKLTNELEEAKRTLETQQKKLLVYAQIFSNGTGAQVVIPPAYIGRRVHSSPTTPSYAHGTSYAVSRNPQLAYDLQEVPQRKHAYDPISDVVPKGSRNPNDSFKFERQISFSDSENEKRKNSSVNVTRSRSKSVASMYPSVN